MRGTFGDWWNARNRWSSRTFGKRNNRGIAGPLAHLRKELDELEQNPQDIMEHADVLFLAGDIAFRAGFSYGDILKACWQKLEINKARKWGKPDAKGVVEHVR